MGFTIQNSGGFSKDYTNSSIEIQSNDNIIQNNIITNNECNGILINNSKYNIISKNQISNNYHGVIFRHSTNNTITNNIITQNEIAACLQHSNNNTVNFNSLSKNNLGMCTNNATLNNISSNIFLENTYGLYIYYSNCNKITKNNFIDNTRRTAMFKGTIKHKNTWDQNYWNRARILPKAIFGRVGYFGLSTWIVFDKNPAGGPNNIQPLI